MQSQVRFYITQNDDQAVVRTIPVQQRPVMDSNPVVEAKASDAPVATSTQRKVSKLMRSAVKRGGTGS